MDKSTRADAAGAYAAEAFSLLGISIAVTALRVCYRVKTVGIKGLQADDYFVLAAVVAQILESCLAYSSVAVTQGLANNSMTNEQRARLSPSSEEYRLRVIGSKIQAAGWLAYIFSIWSFKIAMCSYYLRLVSRLRRYRRRINSGFVFIGVALTVALLTYFLTCRPFSGLWQINPNPGINCQPSISPAILQTLYVMNIVTDFYLIYIPLPILWKSTIKLKMKIGLCFLFCCAIFIIMAATLRTALVSTHHADSAGISGPWAVRETFVAAIVTNLPVLFPACKECLWSFFTSSRRLLSHHEGSRRASGEKDLEHEAGDNGADTRKTQRARSFYRISESTTAGSMGAEFTRTSDTAPSTLAATPSGSRPENGTDNQKEHRAITPERGYHEAGDKVFLNRPESRRSDGKIAPVPPCKIRKSVEISVNESERASRALGNFTSAWGPRRKRRGPGRLVNVRTPYLPDHLNPEQYEAEAEDDRRSDEIYAG